MSNLYEELEALRKSKKSSYLRNYEVFSHNKFLLDKNFLF